MNRQIKIELADPHQAIMRGIYRIDVGRKFYIGQALRFAARVKQHEKSINLLLETQHDVLEKDMYLHWIEYLHENPRIQVLKARLIHYCKNGVELSEWEDRILKSVEGDDRCLNRGFSCQKVYTTFDFDWLYRFYPDEGLYFYKGEVPSVQYRSDAPLRPNGNICMKSAMKGDHIKILVKK
jgi:hypothetical protein